MSLTFIHLSDIHFGQESGSERVVHDDVKEHLIEDAVQLLLKYSNSCATGVIVTGDIAFSGKEDEYQSAGIWLDKLTEAINCKKTNVQVVPGNHDIDRSEISYGCQLLLNQIIDNGESALDKILADDLDRENLYRRFHAYRTFAEGYDCPLDIHGGNASNRNYELTSGRTLSFIGLNTALICSVNDEEGSLLLGARQHVLPPREDGRELVVICHHPLDWLQDSENSRNYVQSRARIFVSGHTHKPSVNQLVTEGNCDVVELSAGATIPPNVKNGYNYNYNLIVFGWCEDSNRLKMKIVPRAWSPSKTRFVSDLVNFPKTELNYLLECPNFQKTDKEKMIKSESALTSISESESQSGHVEQFNKDESNECDSKTDAFRLLLLQFFRDLSPEQRIAVFVKVGGLPNEWYHTLTHNIERQILDALVNSGKLAELQVALDEVQSESN